jgi:bifunctional non-homologous end joining protein LigD
MPRFAIHKQQILSEDELNNTTYYLRLEIEEAKVLRSWKIHQSIPSEPGYQSKAVMYQQDLPLVYLYIEKSPEEEDYSNTYELDAISLWDTGIYKSLITTSITEQIRSGRVELFFSGTKLYGRFSLVRESLSASSAGISSSQQNHSNNNGDIWYFVKEHEEDDSRRRAGLTARQQSSSPSQRQKTAVSKMQQPIVSTAPATTPSKQHRAVATPPTIAAGFPRMIKPMLATPIDEPFDDEQWAFEFKWDGVRSILFLNKAKGILEIQSRNGKSISHRYPEVIDQIKKSLNNNNIRCKESVILDGEIVVLNERGVPDFQRHQRRMNVESALEIVSLAGKIPATYYIFDVLYLDGRNLQGLPFVDRRKILSDVILDGADSRIRISEYVGGQGRQMFEQARSMGLEGIVAKWKHGRYLQGSRSSSWLKVKRIRTHDCVIVGYTPGEGRREGYFGSLLLAVNDQGNFRFVGHTGSGFDTVTIMELYDRLQELRISRPPQDILDTVQFVNREPIWVKPELVAEVKFSEWTKDGVMRIPIFVRLREDKSPQDCIIEKEKGLEEIGSLASSVMPASANAAATVEFSNLDKIFWPQTKENPALTKKDLVDYYDSISLYILPYLKDRPLSLLRFPDGIEGQSFFHRNWEGQSRPKYVASVMVYTETRKKKTNQLVCDNKETLLWLANLGCIEMHPMLSSVIDYERCQESEDPNDAGCGLNMPDFVVIDLDPYIYVGTEKQEKGEEPYYNIQAFKATVEVALELKEIMDGLHLRSYVKTSGKTGLHIFIPISKLSSSSNNAEPVTYEKTREFAKKIGNLLVERIPQKVTMEWNIKERSGKVFFDHNQNSRAKTLASVFSVRPTSPATVSMPVRWDKLTDILPTDFTLLNVPEIVNKSGNAWKQMLEDRQDILLSS